MSSRVKGTAARLSKDVAGKLDLGQTSFEKLCWVRVLIILLFDNVRPNDLILFCN